MNTFSEITGNEFIINSLKNAVKNKKVSHAYIFDGARGTGKKLLAGAFAKTLQCQEGGSEPCGRCVSCKTFDDRNHPDVFYVTPSKSVKIGVDDIREQVHQNLKIKPYSYDYKIFIIENAHQMTVQAQNALLKNIEEPPEYGVFLLLSQNISNFLPTILSRCVIFKIKPLKPRHIRTYMAARGLDENMLPVVEAYAGGSIGEAIRISEDAEFLQMRDEVLQMITEAGTGSIARAFALVKGFEKYREHILEALDILYVWYRDVLLYKSTGRDAAFIGADKKTEIIAFASARDMNLLVASIEAVLEAKKAFQFNANFQMVMEVLSLTLSGIGVEDYSNL